MSTADSKNAALLDLMLADMESADPLYKPTNFWSSGLPELLKDIRERGIATFRSHPSSHLFYVPTYASTSLPQKVASAVLGRLRYTAGLRAKVRNEHVAEFHHRIVRGLNPPEGWDLLSFSESDHGHPVEQLTIDGRRYSRSSLNYLRGLVLLKRTIPDASITRVLELGGGFGTLGEILLKVDPSATYVDADIPPVGFAATHYLQQVFGREKIADYAETREWETIDVDQLARAGRSAVIASWQLPRVRGTVDLFVNFISFQEMEPHVVSNYARLVDELEVPYVLLRQQRDGKPVAAQEGAVGVLEPVTRQTYIDAFANYDLLAVESTLLGDDRLGGCSEVLVFRRRS